MVDTPDEQDDSLQDDSLQDERFAEALAEYYRRRAAGPVDAQALAREFADVGEKLLAYLVLAEGIPDVTPHWVPAAAKPQLPPLKVLRYFGDYELLEEIARGGMGVVYRARQVSLNRMVAVKMILAGRLASEEDVTRFHQEAGGAARLNHPHVVTIYEIGEHDGQHYFSMEYIEGSNLAQLTREQPLPGRLAAEYVQTIAETMRDVHRAGLLHRDLKPSNVLLESRTGRLRISDFGLAKTTDAVTQFTVSGQALGTPGYTPPEQASGRHQEVGPQSDIYAMGAILYELVTGRAPFVGETPWDTAWQVLHLEPVAPRALNPSVARDLETICLKCLQKQRDRRYGTAEELAEDLGRYLRGEPILARPVSFPERAWRWGRRNPALSGSLVAAALGFCGLLGSLIMFADTQQKHAEILAEALQVSEARLRESNLHLAENERDKGLQHCAQGDIDHGCFWLARSLATAPPDAADLQWSIRINLAAWRRELSTLQQVLPAESHAVFSSDGQRFATSQLHPPLVRVRETSSGQVVSPPMPHERFNVRLSFGNSHRTLLVESGSQHLSLWQETDGTWQERFAGDAHHHRLVNDERLVTAEWTEQGWLVKNALADEPLGRLIPANAPEGFVISPNGRYVWTPLSRNRSRLRSLETGEPLGRPLAHDSPVSMAAFFPDSQHLLTGLKTMQGNGLSQVMGQIWETETATRTGVLQHASADGRLERIIFSDGGDRVFTASHRGTLLVWDEDGRHLAGPLAMVGNQFSVSGDGRLLVFTAPASNLEARIWDVDSQRVISQPLGRLKGAYFLNDAPEVTLSPDGRQALICTPEEARLWRLPDRGFTGPSHELVDEDPDLVWLDFSRDGNRLLVGSLAAKTGKSFVQLWDVRRQIRIGVPREMFFGVQSLALRPDGRWIAVGSSQNLNRRNYQGIYLWRVEPGEASVRNLPSYEEITHDLEFTRDGQRLVSIGDMGRVHVYDVERDEIVLGPLEHPATVADGQAFRLALSPDDQRLAVFVRGGSLVRLLNLETGQPVCPPWNAAGRVRAITFSPDGQTLAVTSDQLQLYDSKTGAASPITLEAVAGAGAAAFSPDGQWIAAVQEDRTVRVWHTATGRLVGRPLVHAEQPSKVQFAAGGTLLFTSTAKGGRLWELRTGTQVGPLWPPAQGYAISPDGNTVAVADGRVLRLRTVPQPAVGQPASLVKGLQTDTGLTWDGLNALRPMTLEEWQAEASLR